MEVSKMASTALKQSVTLTVDREVYSKARQEKINVSALLTRTLENEIRRLEAQRWKEENREGIEALNRFIEENGSFADQVRRF
ncbi:TPA: type II toxin-antitoxin system CcdA family antitoxin [Enterobacter kobei]|nr:type II toxin-antitoxin system CcdA family antitoxin [Enterobacter asburiae]HCR1912154.1 type II toxin-antitoxin system CcdA family antitoxin [Enterobacter kobei]